LYHSAQKAQIVGDVGQSIPWIYVPVDNKQANHQASILKMEGGARGRVPDRASMHLVVKGAPASRSSDRAS